MFLIGMVLAYLTVIDTFYLKVISMFKKIIVMLICGVMLVMTGVAVVGYGLYIESHPYTSVQEKPIQAIKV